MPTFELNFDVYCSCGNGLCLQSDATSRYGDHKVTVEPCAKCLEEAREDGYSKGLEDGRNEE